MMNSLRSIDVVWGCEGSPASWPEVFDYIWVLHSQIGSAWFKTRSSDGWFEVSFGLHPNSLLQT